MLVTFATGEPVSLFPIYNNAVQYITEGQMNLSDAYNEYAIWRYFTGSRSIPGQYFNQSSGYCEALTISDFDGDFIISSNKGATHFVELPNNVDLVVSADYPENIQLSHLKIDSGNNVEVSEVIISDNFAYISTTLDTDNIMVIASKYNDIVSDDINFSISINQSDVMGDLNGDSLVNVQDVVLAVNLALIEDYNESVDFNLDYSIDILDIVFLINIVLS